MAGLFGTGPWCPDDGHHHQAGVLFQQARAIHAKLAQRRGPKRCNQHIGARQNLVQLLLTGGRFQIRLNDFHALVQGGVGRRFVLSHWVGRQPRRAARRRQRFKLGALRAHGFQAHDGGRARQIQRQGQHAHAFEGVGDHI